MSYKFQPQLTAMECGSIRAACQVAADQMRDLAKRLDGYGDCAGQAARCIELAKEYEAGEALLAHAPLVWVDE